MDFNDGAIVASVSGSSGQALLDDEIQNEWDGKARALGST
jgi:hypothetical protein